MGELRSALEEARVAVRCTYLQSGNVVFDATRAPTAVLARRVECAIQPKLSRPTAAVVLSASQLGRVLTDAPADWGGKENAFAHHIVFVVPPLTARQLLIGRQFDPDTERITSKGRVIYWSIRKDTRSRSDMTRLARTPAYRHITIRTHALVRRLYALTHGP
jgi:uncharacterized protein (DUF1697 family)